ncbi:NTP transferase domain-containing protein [Pelagibacterales bacterium SAG-MED43]|nr:NTP transferase domain-containing protein [Pelagibacterales bacterium SAG-MED43]
MKLKTRSNKIFPIILAAGRGSRMGNLTKNKPKSFVRIDKKKKLIDNVIEKFENSVLEKITIITGYKSDQFKNFKKADKIRNKKWKTTNIFGSLIHADRILSKYVCIISYADIFYEQEAIEILKNSKTKRGIVVLSYKYWKKYWKKRFKNPLSDLETFRVNSKNQLIEIGNRANSYSNIKGQYMGLFKIDPYSWNKIKICLFKKIKNLNKIDITALFQLIIKNKICNIHVKNYKKKWFEIDNIKDYKVFKKSLKN